MRAVVFREYGDADVLHVEDLPDPRPGTGQVLVRVEHAGVNFAEVMFRRGQIPVGLPHVPGLEVAGVVTEVGPDVEGVAVGDRVVALTLGGGGYAELAVADAVRTVVLDGDLAQLGTDVAAAAVCNVTTAWGVVHLAARPQPGERVLVLAAGGGVGGAVGRLAAASGAHVVGATGDRAKSQALPADVFAERVTYDDLLASSDTFDVVLDSVGGDVRRALASRLRVLGRHVAYGDAAQDDATRAFDDVWFSGAAVVGYNLGALAYARPALLAEHLRAALRAVADGTVPVPFTTVPLADVAGAHRALEGRRTTGKLVAAVGAAAGAAAADVVTAGLDAGAAPVAAAAPGADQSWR